jgi:hypothetical protein
MIRLATRKSQHGSALVELAVVVVGLLGALLLLTGLIGKQIDAKHDYEQGLRYAAWERTVWLAARNSAVPNAPVKSSAEIGNEIQARVFADRNAVLRSDQRTGNQTVVMDHMLDLPTVAKLDSRNNGARSWFVDRNNNNNGRPLYAFRSETNNRLSGVAAQGVNTMIQGLEAISRFNVQNNGLYRTQVQADLGDTGYYREFRVAPNSNQPLDLRVDRQRNGQTRNLTLLADGWNVGGPGHAAQQASSLVATEFLDNAAIDTVMNVVGWFPMAREIGWLEFGHVDPEQVPAQRLGRYR